MTPTAPAPHRLMDHLPAIYQGAETPLARFLAAFDALFFDGGGESGASRGLARVIEELPRLLDPRATPEAFLPWLASWVALNDHPDVPADVMRDLIGHAIPLYRWQGTRLGLETLLALVSRGRVSITEPDAAGFRVGAAVVGVSTVLGIDRPHRFDVHVDLPATSTDAALAAAPAMLRRFIDEAKPAHTQYRLTVARGGD